MVVSITYMRENMNWKYWIKKHWWKPVLIVAIPVGLYILWWIKKHNESKDMFEDLSEKWHKKLI